MYDHIGLQIENVDASVRFYSAALGPLGLVLCSHDASGAGFGPLDAPALWLYRVDSKKGMPARPVHVALHASDRAMVDRFYNLGLSAGGRDNGGPSVRTDYSPTYYAAFLLDPDGNNIEAVCLR